MRIDNGSFAFNCPGCPAWGTAIVNQDKELIHLIKTDIATDIIIGMLHKQVDFRTHDFSVPIGKGSRVYYGDQGFDGATSEPILVAKFDKVYVNDVRVNHPFVLSIIKDRAVDHAGRLQLKWTPKMTYGDVCNENFISAACVSLGITAETPWAVYDIDIIDQEKLVFSAIISDSWESVEDELKKLTPTYTTPFIEKKHFYDKMLLQQIYYGAPGTGKSHMVDEITFLQPKENVFRTTFHPDSDYSTFVGCYKPTKKVGEVVLSVSQAIDKLKEYKADGKGYPCHRFSTKYWNTIREFSTEQQKILLKACEFTESMTNEFAKGAAIGEYFYSDMVGSITYEFVPQVFVKAYVRAHQTDEPVFLVIEEINRGNCAQIFGDIFQLLDRDENGVSNYAIKPDSDLEQYLMEHVEGYNPEEGMRLPKNLYIWATMNTSDQSLFPIDSAFKRRWDWTYVPIDTKKEDWKIDVGNGYYWSSFLEKINFEIEDTTSSEDKMLGFYFCKAENKVISADKFVGKVLFYIYNDVFKDFDHSRSFFVDNESSKKIRFKDFFNMDGTINQEPVKKLLNNLGVEECKARDVEPGESGTPNPDSHKAMTVVLDGEEMTDGGEKHFDFYMSVLEKIGYNEAGAAIEASDFYRMDGSCKLASREQHELILNNDKGFSYVKGGDYYFVKGINVKTMVTMLNYLNGKVSKSIVASY